jgi:sugar/nucleoside kinase (ribokinase family)
MRTGEEVQDRREAKAAGGIVCVGNFIVDRIHTLSYWPEQGSLAHIRHQDMGVGGGAANVVTDLASLGFGRQLSIAGAVGDDRDGDYVRERHARLGIDVEGLRTLQDHATAHTHVMNVPGQSRTFFYHGGANDLLTDSTVDPTLYAASGHRIFYLGYLMLLPALDRRDETGSSGAARLLKAARDAGLLTCVDFVSSEDPDFADRVGAALPHCDYVIVNETEAGRATGITVRNTQGVLLNSAVEAAGRKLLEGGVSKGVVIHAPELCIWLAPDRPPILTPAYPVDASAIVSPVGAGDAFCAAVLYGLHEGWPIETISAVAHRAAVHCLGGATATDGIPDMSVLLAEIGDRVPAAG